jgi:hypothetical protein
MSDLSDDELKNLIINIPEKAQTPEFKAVVDNMKNEEASTISNQATTVASQQDASTEQINPPQQEGKSPPAEIPQQEGQSPPVQTSQQETQPQENLAESQKVGGTRKKRRNRRRQTNKKKRRRQSKKPKQKRI